MSVDEIIVWWNRRLVAGIARERMRIPREDQVQMPIERFDPAIEFCVMKSLHMLRQFHLLFDERPCEGMGVNPGNGGVPKREHQQHAKRSPEEGSSAASRFSHRILPLLCHLFIIRPNDGRGQLVSSPRSRNQRIVQSVEVVIGGDRFARYNPIMKIMKWFRRTPRGTLSSVVAMCLLYLLALGPVSWVICQNPPPWVVSVIYSFYEPLDILAHNNSTIEKCFVAYGSIWIPADPNKRPTPTPPIRWLQVFLAVSSACWLIWNVVGWFGPKDPLTRESSIRKNGLT